MIDKDLIYSIDNEQVAKSFLRANAILDTHKRIQVAISGGADSDCMLDIIEKVKTEKNELHYVFFNTGVEYQATLKHLDYLETKYKIKIDRIKAEKPIPQCIHEYGIPFLSKYVSGMIEPLQKAGFKFEDKPYEELLEEYKGKNLNSYLKWWCNLYGTDDKFYTCMNNIAYYPMLKEFLVSSPPQFRISAKCCTYAKKHPAKRLAKETQCDLVCTGIRKSEGGVRAMAYKSCFVDSNDNSADKYMPLFWWHDNDKKYYEEKFDIKHSDCYEKYGFTRTGCVGCPFAYDIEDNLERIKMFEPKLYKACINMFNASYEYKREFKKFRADKKRTMYGQMDFMDDLQNGLDEQGGIDD